MANEPTQPEETVPDPAPVDAPVEEAPTVEAVTDETPPVEAPADDTPVEAEPALDPSMVEEVPEEPPADPIITDPVLPDEPADPVFETPLILLDPPAVAILEAMPEEDKTVLQGGITTDYWGDYEHFQCTIPNCQRDFLSYAAMVSHVVTEHQPADMDTPEGTRAVRDRYGSLVAYEEI